MSQEIPDRMPHGSIAELEAINADLSRFGACAKRVKEDGQIIVMGCHEFQRCVLKGRDSSRPKDDEGARGVGPVNKGVEYIKFSPNGDVKHGRKVVGRLAMTCYHIPGFKDRVELNGGLVRIIANEGEIVNMQGSEFEDKVIPGQGMTRTIIPKLMPITIKPHPRPGQEYNLQEQLLASEIMDAESDKRRAEHVAEIVGVKKPDGRKADHPQV